jgi:anion-transporting  ArsA/GET3 family ATPase
VVMLAEPLPDRQTARLIAELNQLRVQTSAVFVNRVRMEESRCRHCQIARRWQLHTLAGLRERLKFYGEIFVIPNFPRELAGRRGLQSLTREIWRLEARQPAKPRARRRKM